MAGPACGLGGHWTWLLSTGLRPHCTPRPGDDRNRPCSVDLPVPRLRPLGPGAGWTRAHSMVPGPGVDRTGRNRRSAHARGLQGGAGGSQLEGGRPPPTAGRCFRPRQRGPREHTETPPGCAGSEQRWPPASGGCARRGSPSRPLWPSGRGRDRGTGGHPWRGPCRAGVDAAVWGDAGGAVAPDTFSGGFRAAGGFPRRAGAAESLSAAAPRTPEPLPPLPGDPSLCSWGSGVGALWTGRSLCRSPRGRGRRRR